MNTVGAAADRFRAEPPYGVALEAQADGLIYDLRVRGPVKPVPSVIAILYGDALQNLRSTLDHLVFHLRWLHEGHAPHQPKDVKFPIARTEASWNSQWPAAIGHAVDPGAIAIIREAQPFRSPDPTPEDSLMWKLHELNNRDKHRLMLLTNLYGRVLGLGPADADKHTPPALLDLDIDSGHRVEENAIAGTVAMNERPDADMHVNVATEIGIDEPGWPLFELFTFTVNVMNVIIQNVVRPLAENGHFRGDEILMPPELFRRREAAKPFLGSYGFATDEPPTR